MFAFTVILVKADTTDFEYKGLGYKGLMRDNFSGPFVQNVRNFRQL